MFDEVIEEAMSFVSYMDVSDIRMLYYGRQDLYVAFSDDSVIPKSGFESNMMKRPFSVVSYTVDTVVGRKASSNLLYGHVFRYKKSKGYIQDIRSYSTIDYDDDIGTLKVLSYIDQELLEEAIERVNNNATHRTTFSKIWSITQAVASVAGDWSDRLWRRVLMDLGYTGFTDNGSGVIGNRNQITNIILNYDDIVLLEILPIQKYRKEKRRNVDKRINHINKQQTTKRNRIAKVSRNG
jgi:hypothetical protein